jgi:hypothetical protein
LDARIQADLDKFVNGPARQYIERAKADLALWIAATKVVELGRFSKDHQEAVGRVFGEGVLQSLKSFLSDSTADQLEMIVRQKMQKSREELVQMIPISFDKEYDEIGRRMLGVFSKTDTAH